jgi:hypothetical protein
MNNDREYNTLINVKNDFNFTYSHAKRSRRKKDSLINWILNGLSNINLLFVSFSESQLPRTELMYTRFTHQIDFIKAQGSHLRNWKTNSNLKINQNINNSKSMCYRESVNIQISIKS